MPWISGWIRLGGLRPHEVRAEQPPGPRVGHQLADAGGVLHRPAVRRVAVRLGGADVGDALRADLVLGAAHAGDLRVGEDGRRDVPVVHLAQALGVDQVVRDDARLVVGDVLELVRRRDVTERPDPLDVRPAVAVDRDAAVGVGRDPRRPPAPGRRCWGRGRWRRAAGRSRRCCRRRGRGGRRGRRRSRATTSVPSRTSQRSAAISVNRSLTSESSWRSSRVPRTTRVTCTPERGEDVGELGGDVAAAEDDHPRAGRSSIRITVSEVWNGTPDRDDDVGDHGVAAGGDDHLVGGEGVTGRDLQGARAGEPGVTEERGGVGAVDAVVLPAARDRVDPAEDAVADVLPAHPVQGGVDAEPPAGGDGVGDVGGVDEHLGGDAADVEAGAAEGAALDQGDLLVLEAPA